jgi:hypothetical protein
MVAAINNQGELVNAVKLPARGHDTLVLPNKPGHALVFCRRPDRFAVEIDFINGKIVNHIQRQVDSHFMDMARCQKTDNTCTPQKIYTTKNAV